MALHCRAITGDGHTPTCHLSRLSLGGVCSVGGDPCGCGCTEPAHGPRAWNSSMLPGWPLPDPWQPPSSYCCCFCRVPPSRTVRPAAFSDRLLPLRNMHFRLRGPTAHFILALDEVPLCRGTIVITYPKDTSVASRPWRV